MDEINSTSQLLINEYVCPCAGPCLLHGKKGNADRARTISLKYGGDSSAKGSQGIITVHGQKFPNMRDNK